jgi:CheY-like chemotaxis protein
MARVLLVDDDRSGLEIRRMIFEHAGHEVTTASSAEEAIAVSAAAVSPIACSGIDAVILDLWLPELDDGLALIRSLRERMPGAKLIVLSGRPEDLEGHAERSMVDELLMKPAHSAQLLELIAG